MNTGPWKLCLSMAHYVSILSFLTEEASSEAEDFYKRCGWNTIVIRDQIEEQAAEITVEDVLPPEGDTTEESEDAE